VNGDMLTLAAELDRWERDEVRRRRARAIDPAL
jgi:hypothetical protein